MIGQKFQLFMGSNIGQAQGYFLRQLLQKRSVNAGLKTASIDICMVNTAHNFAIQGYWGYGKGS